MKTVLAARRKRKLNFQTDIFPLSHAKTYLGRLLAKAAKGEAVYIISGQQRFSLQPVPPIDPIPIRPPGYFDNCYTKPEIQEQNRLAKASLFPAPKDLE